MQNPPPSARAKTPNSSSDRPAIIKAPLFGGPVMVTGGTGFLGQYLVRRLLAIGQPVRTIGRNLKIGLALQAEGADFRPVDLRDAAGLMTAFEGIEAVIHAGALSTVWGKPSEFHATNVGGTENVIAACLARGVKRLVYISSPSVMTRTEAQWNLKESDPLPDEHVSLYSLTKRLAEERVRAVADRMETVILRPKAIYGIGDTAIFPRLIKSSLKGRLPIIGDGDTVTNLTHVDDVVDASLLALKSKPAVGNTYVATGGEDVRIWDTIKDVIRRSGLQPPTRRIPVSRAMRVARILEWVWRTFRLPGEPPITTYSVGILGLSQTYDITAARRDLGYEPKVTMARGIDETFAFADRVLGPGAREGAERASGVLDILQKVPANRPKPPTAPAAEPRPIDIAIRTAGRVIVRSLFFQPWSAPGARPLFRRFEIPALFAIIEHPEQGLILWDTGYAPRFFEATRRLPWRVLRWVTPTVIDPKEAAVEHVKTLGYAPEDVRTIILSHFDPDHFGGLKDFPSARIVCSWRAWNAVRSLGRLGKVKARLLPGHLPEDMAGRLWLLPDFNGPPISVFESSLDLFGDGSVRLVNLPGHAAGQMGAFVRRKSDGADLFLAADGCWNQATLEAAGYRGGAHRLIAVDKKAQDETYERLRKLHKDWPSLRIVPSHCPRAWRETADAEGKVSA